MSAADAGPPLDRLVVVTVEDRYGRRLPGADVSFEIDGHGVADVRTGPSGAAQVQIPPGGGALTVRAAYPGLEPQEARLATGADSYRFTFDTGVPPMSNYGSAAIGLVLLAAGTFLAFYFPDPTTLQARIVMALVSLGGGGVAAAIPGFLRIQLDLWQKVAVGGAGALGVFLVLFFFTPLNPVNPPRGDAIPAAQAE